MKAKQKTTTKEAKKAKVLKTVKEQIEAINQALTPEEEIRQLINGLSFRLEQLGYKDMVIMCDNGKSTIEASTGNVFKLIGLCEFQKVKMRVAHLSSLQRGKNE